MVIDKKINQINAAGNCHGYWKETDKQGHYYNDKLIGCRFIFLQNHALYKTHWKYNEVIGCVLFIGSNKDSGQLFYKSHNKKFGEYIKWK